MNTDKHRSLPASAFRFSIFDFRFSIFDFRQIIRHDPHAHYKNARAPKSAGSELMVLADFSFAGD